MKNSVVLKSVIAIVFAVLFVVGSGFGQTSVEAKSARLTGNELYKKIMSETATIPLDMYPPGHMEWLLELGDELVPLEEPLRYERPVRSEPLGPLVPESDGMETMGRPSPFDPAPEYDYVIKDIGTLSWGFSFPRGINNRGQVVGISAIYPSGSMRAFLYSNETMIDLGTLGGGNSFCYGGLNEYGQVVGESETTNSSRAFLYSGGIMVDIGKLDTNPPYNRSSAHAINSSGKIVGLSAAHGFLYFNGTMTDIGTFVGNTESHVTSAEDINDYGDITGYSSLTNGPNHAFLMKDNVMENIGTLGGSGSVGFSINSYAEVVGESVTSNGQRHAFFYDTSMQDLGVLNGETSSMAVDINNHAHVVGSSGDRAFILSNGSMRVLSNHVVNISDWSSLTATSINDNGQIAGWGSRTGYGRGFILNPLPLGWSNTYAGMPSVPVYGNMPARAAGKTNLIFITHGAIPSWENPTTSVAWIDSMSNSVAQYLATNGKTDWQVVPYKWIDKAKYNPNTLSSRFSTPQDALNNAMDEGNKLGSIIKTQGWQHIHLIAHSAGAGMIQSITDAVKPSSTVVHCTFLDPYVGNLFYKKYFFGNNSDWSDQYFSHDSETFGPIGWTESPLNHAFNVDVTPLLKVKDIYSFASRPNGSYGPCYRSVDSHRSAIMFYSNTITGNITSSYEGFGFPMSEESVGWTWTSTNLVGNGTSGSSVPIKVLGVPDDICTTFTEADPQTLLNVSVSQLPTIKVGDVTTYAYGHKLVTHSPSWISIVCTPTNAVNFVSFYSQFLSTNAYGLVTVYWDTNIIGSIDERVESSGMQYHTMSFPFTDNGSHTLGFRIDPLTNLQSSIIVTNIALGVVGPSQPFSLVVTTNKIAGSQEYELKGQAGFNYLVDASTNLINWETIAVLSNTNGIVRFYDQSSTNYSQRYYRAVSPYQLAH